MADVIYNMEWLTEKFDEGRPIQYIFFSGHTSNGNEDVGKFVLNQWFHSPFVVDEVHYRTAAHWMMAHKALLFDDVQTFNSIVNAGSTAEVKALGRQIQGFDEDKWNQHKFEIVKRGNVHKFNQNDRLREFLLSTNDDVIVEANPADKIWGIGLAEDASTLENPHAWNGSNLLGFALMEVRDFLRAFGSFQYSSGPVLPPWKKFPQVAPLDMFWRMGVGEQYVTEFGAFYESLSEKEKTIYQLSYPVNDDWSDYYK